MKDYQEEFIKFAISQRVLIFGQFQLKSGRVSPYFFNAGLFNTGNALNVLGNVYASAIKDNQADLEFDVLFGPAYKGIPLVAATGKYPFVNSTSGLAMKLASDGSSIPYSYNRKEAKNHGEGGTLVGASIDSKRVLIVDDVMTAGTAVRESLDIITKSNGKLAGVIVALDREEIADENDTDRCSAVMKIRRDFGVPVVSVVGMSDIIEYLEKSGTFQEHLESMKSYRIKYGIK